MQDTSPPDRDLTAEDVAKIAQVHRATVHRWARSGTLPGMKRPGRKGHYRFSRADVEQLMERMRSGAA